MRIGPRCKITRRLGTNLFIKCEKVFERKPYPPGQRGKRRRRGGGSEFGKELREKQKLKFLYNISERQFKNHVKGILKKKGYVEDTSSLLIQELESRLDNVIFRLGFAKSRSQARQFTSHAHFLVNGKPVDIPSYHVRAGDVISIRSSSQKKTIFHDLPQLLKKHQPPSWLELDSEKMEGKVKGFATLQEAMPPVEIPAIFEFYSR